MEMLKWLESELFYLSQYRFGINLYLTGENGNASRVSLYLHLAEGKFDGVLQ